MIVFDPEAMTAPLSAIASELRAASDAPAVLARAELGDRTARVADGIGDLATGAVAHPEQTFDIGSQTKMMTAVVVLQLVEGGLVELDAPAARWLPPEVVDGVPNADTATVRQLLAMTSGVPNYTEAVDADGVPLFVAALRDNPGVPFRPHDALALARDMPATGAPGAAFSYTNTGYLLLGAMIEEVTGERLADVLQDRIFDPVGMDATTARAFAPDDRRLSSYATDPTSGATIDVTDVPLVLKGEGGVISTTADMIAFLRALLVEHSLLGPEALAAMTDFRTIADADGVEQGFGLGIGRYVLDGGRELVGFTGESLGTTSSTFLETGTSTIASIAGTRAEVATDGGVLQLLDEIGATAAWTASTDDGDRLHIETGSAADLRLTRDPDGLHLTLDGATLTLDRRLGDLSTDEIEFADGSVLALGTNTDDAIAIARDHHGAVAADNQLRGFGGDDRLTGAAGADRLSGGAGDDHLRGAAGDDVLRGGSGRDILTGGAGADWLIGGAGDDIFRFGPGGGEGIDAGTDRIRDFEPGRDKVALAPYAADGGPDLVWIGSDGFGGTAGEVRSVEEDGVAHVSADIDGDGVADFSIRIAGSPVLGADDFIL